MTSPMAGPSPMSASAGFRAQLSQLSGGGLAHRELADRYRAILDSILQLSEDELVEGLKVGMKPRFYRLDESLPEKYLILQVFIEAIVNENVSLVISRQLLSEVSQRMVKMQDDSVSKAVSHYTLDVVQPRVISFEDQVSRNRS